MDEFQLKVFAVMHPNHQEASLTTRFNQWWKERGFHLFDVWILLANDVQEIASIDIEQEVMTWDLNPLQLPTTLTEIVYKGSKPKKVNGKRIEQPIKITKKYNFTTDKGIVSIGEGYARTTFNDKQFKIDYDAGTITYNDGEDTVTIGPEYKANRTKRA
jgi:hypothetical protein